MWRNLENEWESCLPYILFCISKSLAFKAFFEKKNQKPFTQLFSLTLLGPKSYFVCLYHVGEYTPSPIPTYWLGMSIGDVCVEDQCVHICTASSPPAYTHSVLIEWLQIKDDLAQWSLPQQII